MIEETRIEKAVRLCREIHHAPYCGNDPERGNGAGGNLHIVIDDGNTERGDVEWCKEEALKDEDILGEMLCDFLLTFSDAERAQIYRLVWGR